MFKRLLNANARLVSSKPWLVLAVALAVTIIAGFFATNLSMELSWISLAPEGSPAVLEYEEIMNDFPSLDSIVVLVESDDYTMLEKAVNETTAKCEELDEYVTSVVSGVDREFMLENAMLFMSDDEAQMMEYIFADGNADKMYEFMYFMTDETIKAIQEGDMTDEEINYSAASFSAIKDIIDESNSALTGEINNENIDEALKKMFAGSSLITSPDGKMAMLTIQPSFDMMDMEKLTPGVNAIESVIKEVNDSYDNVTVRATGMHIVARDEMASVESDSYLSTLISIILILAVLYFAFRAWIAPVFAVTPLLFGIVWAMGITGLTVGRLNMMTVFAVAMLLGLGVDYAIHMYSSYTERRSRGVAKDDAISYAICHTGPSIIVGALTTAIAFFALNISRLRVLSELGTVMGTGIITTLAAVFWILPALIKIKKEKEETVSRISGDYVIIGWIAKGVYKFKFIVLAVIVLGAAFMGYQASKVEFDMNLMNLEPKGLESIELMNYMVEKYDMSSNSFALQVDSLDEVYRLQKEFENVDNVAEVVSVASILPETEKQQQQLNNIQQVKDDLEYGKADLRTANKDVLLQYVSLYADKVNELEDAWIENDLPILREDDFEGLRQSLKELEDKLSETVDENNLSELSSGIYYAVDDIQNIMLSGGIVTPSDLPDAYKSQFLSRDGSKYMITIYPDFEIWDALGTEKGDKFLSDLAAVNPRVTGTPIFMMDLYNAVGSELLLTGIILIAVLFLILMIHFRSVKYTLLAFLPLAFTLVYMMGTMVLFGIKFNMINFLVVLLIIGIGLDDGVHVLHHYKEGEKDIKKLFSTIGRAILLTTVTTVFGFGSLSFSSYRGIAGLGVVLAIGVSMALLFTIIVIPIFLKDEQDIK